MLRPSIAALLLVPAIAAQDLTSWIITVNRAGLVELIDPITLETGARIHIELPPQTVGLNGIAAGSDGTTLYLEGPIPESPISCCALYSVDLTTLEARLAASYYGTRSRESFLISDGVVYQRSQPSRNNDRLILSANGLLLFGVQSFRGPVLNVYDAAKGTLVRRLAPDGLEGDWWPVGTWSSGRFYWFVYNESGAGRLWSVTPQAAELGMGITVTTSGQLPACQAPVSLSIVASAGNLFCMSRSVLRWIAATTAAAKYRVALGRSTPHQLV